VSSTSTIVRGVVRHWSYQAMPARRLCFLDVMTAGWEGKRHHQAMPARRLCVLDSL
jgi:hypothetical protein